MLTFNKLNALSRKAPAENMPTIKIAVLGDTATQLLVSALKGCAYFRGYYADIYESEYNQIFTEIIDDNSGLYASDPEFTVIYMSSEKLYDEYCKTPLDARSRFAQTVAEKISSQWNMIANHNNSRIIQLNFAENNDMIFGKQNAIIHRFPFLA